VVVQRQFLLERLLMMLLHQWSQLVRQRQALVNLLLLHLFLLRQLSWCHPHQMPLQLWAQVRQLERGPLRIQALLEFPRLTLEKQNSLNVSDTWFVYAN
jgi:hypothetical protein